MLATAARRQVSDTPLIDIEVGLAVSNLETGSPLGKLILGDSGLSLSVAGSAILSTAIDLLWDSRTERRVLVSGWNVRLDPLFSDLSMCD